MTACDECYVEHIEEYGDPITVTEERQTLVNGHVVNTREVETLGFCSPMCLAKYLSEGDSR
jgi:hypothetical protein